MKTALQSTQYAKTAQRQGRWYLTFCRANGIQKFPVTHENLGAYIISYVRKNHGSTKSVAHVTAALKNFVQSIKQDWLTRSEWSLYKQIVRQLRYQDVRSTNRKQPLTLYMLQQAFQKLSSNADNLPLLAALYLGHDAMLRSAEILATRVKDIIIEKGAQHLILQLDRSKCHRKGEAQTAVLVDRAGPCAFKLLKTLMTTLQGSPNEYIFQSRSHPNQPLHRSWLANGIKLALRQIHVNPASFSTHSLRAGGATDLMRANVPLEIIKKAGRWRSDEALKYLRDDIFVGYTCAGAFASLKNGGSPRPHC